MKSWFKNTNFCPRSGLKLSEIFPPKCLIWHYTLHYIRTNINTPINLQGSSNLGLSYRRNFESPSYSFSFMPYPCSHFYFDIKFGDRLYSLLNIICRPNWYQSKSDFTDRAAASTSDLPNRKKKYLGYLKKLSLAIRSPWYGVWLYVSPWFSTLQCMSWVE